MNDRGEALKAQIMGALRSRMGVTKSAAPPAELALVEGIISPLCEVIANYEEHVSKVEEHTRYMNRVLKSLEREPPPQGWVPMRAGEWRVGLTPNVPPQQMNGNGHSRPGGPELHFPPEE